MSYPLWEDSRVKGQNIMETRKDNVLENLDESKRSMIVELSMNGRLIDLVASLKEHGISTSTSTLSRFLRRQREKAVLEDGAEINQTVEALAERGKSGRLREGSLEVVRQRLYERALSSQSAEEARLLYAAMVKEETRLKELELEARRVAIAEQQLNLERLKFEVMASAAASAAEGKGKGRVKLKATVTASEAVVESGAIGVGSDGAAGTAGEVARLAGPSESEARLRALLGKVSEVLNRGGDVGERLLEARGMVDSEGRV
jgi:hypothetical protein